MELGTLRKGEFFLTSSGQKNDSPCLHETGGVDREDVDARLSFQIVTREQPNTLITVEVLC